MRYEIIRRENISTLKLRSMHVLRTKIFKTKKRWPVTIIDNMEIDEYDELNPFYLLIEDDSAPNLIIGCWRILPTLGPYMLKNTFPELTSEALPESDDVWELSRFAIQSTGTLPMQFSALSVGAINQIIHFGIKNKLKGYVTVSSLGIERLLRRTDLPVKRLGEPKTIGTEKAVALFVDLKRYIRK
ncbi:MAG: acyl-homoserine-lactone synthase [Mucilaginibacter sp.]|nr:acyl-homoserine-lactone synthase [Mucilaginibacter sp.]